MGEKGGGFAPKLRTLSQSETQATFMETLLFHLTLDGMFEMFLEDGVRWEPVSSANCGLKPDPTVGDKLNKR